jgi:simple sugar transport system ATP-binding protein
MSSGGEAIGCAHVWKRFGEVVANRDVSLSVGRGEIHAVIGENGAGKSTLMRALYGLSPPDEGEVRFGGERVASPSVDEAIRRGIGMVHQHFMLVPTLTVAENVVLGREPTRGLRLDLSAAEKEIAALAEKHGLSLDPRRLVGELSVGEQQRVEIVKVLWRGAEVLILDEPTAVLTPMEVEQLFTVLRALQRDGKTVILVTHKLDEVLALCQRVTVLRRGEVVAAMETAGATAAELARAMVGRDVVLAASRGAPPADDARARLAVESLTVTRADGSRALDGVSLEVKRGEILGVAGVEGNGQTELALAIAGLIPSSGRVRVDGADLSAASVRARQERGVAHVPEDRHARGLVLGFTVEENVLLGREAAYARPLDLDFARLRADTEMLIERLDVRPAEPTATTRALSGGNQQKIVVGREMLRSPSVLVCAQPTRGVDVGAAARIHASVSALKASGGAVLLLSAELDELLALSDRIAVLYRGKLRGVLANDDAQKVRAEVGARMVGAG